MHRRTDSLKSVALQMAALLRANGTPLTGPELAMLLQWLGTVSSAARHGIATRFYVLELRNQRPFVLADDLVRSKTGFTSVGDSASGRRFRTCSPLLRNQAATMWFGSTRQDA